MAWKGIVGLGFTESEFDSYCHSLSWPAWRPQFVVVHNTAVPSLEQRPNGFTEQHIKNLVSFYRDQQGWSAGPHLFVDDHKIWVFTPLNLSGVHSPSFNKIALGMELLGDYKTESFMDGRGMKVRRNAVAALASLHAVLGMDPGPLRLHKEDPRTTHDCPGKNVNKDELIVEVRTAMLERHRGEHVLANS